MATRNHAITDVLGLCFCYLCVRFVPGEEAHQIEMFSTSKLEGSTRNDRKE